MSEDYKQQHQATVVVLRQQTNQLGPQHDNNNGPAASQ